ncbi:alpha/beta hydrolase [Sphingomonas rustica]|uniref:alpha/beta hydrolase n=1 Tax=Sphingomonas rustica TaxID=3103142 RepID=UPI0031FBD56E
MAFLVYRFVMGAAALLASPVAMAAADPAPRFEKAACAIPVAADEKIECGVLIVPEHRGKKGSRTIRLPVMILRSTASSPAPDPVVYLPGGPGLSSIDGRTTGKGNPFLAERDQILLEGRGNKFAQPSLACPELNALRAAGAGDGEQLAAAARCRKTLVAAGVDLDGYSSAEAADDLDDLRRLLGIRHWNLIGFSYGTRLAQTVLARHPDGVRSVVLDSVLPIDINYDEVAAAPLRRALNLVFDGCESDPACTARHPDLRGRFAAAVARADREGTAGPGGRLLRGRDIVDALAIGLQQPQNIPALPKIIDELAAGRAGGLAPWLQPQRSEFNWGLRLSIWCGEEMPFEDPARMAAQASPALGLGGANGRTATPELCAAWKVKAADPIANVATRTDVPVLILAGEFDPVTPPAWGRRLLRTMPNARFVLIPGQVHGAMFNRCGGQLTIAFLRDPNAPLNADCVAKLTGPIFPE